MQTGHRRFIPSAGSAQSASSLLCSPRKVRERQSCKWRLCPTEGSCADLTPGQSLHLLAKSPLEKNIESSLPQPLQSGDWPVKEPKQIPAQTASSSFCNSRGWIGFERYPSIAGL